MSFLRVVVVLSLAVSNLAFAGDACPIGFAMVDLGPIPWAHPALKAKISPKDALFEKLVKVAKRMPCSEVTTARVRAEKPEAKLKLRIHPQVNTDLRVEKVWSAVFKKNRGFQCKSAGKKLSWLGEGAMDGAPVLFVRGHRRILIAVAGWDTVCVGSDEADAMNQGALEKLWKRATRTYVKDRHDNP